MPEILRQFIEGTRAKGARSSVLHSLHVAIGLTFGGFMVSIWLDSPKWVLQFLGLILALLFLLYICSYIYLIRTDKDALRSESFTLSKMAIEKGLVGDDLTGLIQATEARQNLIEGDVSSEGEAKR